MNGLAESSLRGSLPERQPWLWEGMDSELGTMGSESSLPICVGFRAPVELLAVQVVAAATAHAVAAIEDMRANTWKYVVTEPCGLEEEAGLPPGKGLLGRTEQIAKTVVSDAVSRALDGLKMRRVQKWRVMPSECPCPSKLDLGLPPAKGLPRRAAQLAVDVVAATMEQVRSASMAAAAANVSLMSSETCLACSCEQCTICLNDVQRPVELPCGHVFCADCLLRLVSEDRTFNNRACPLCRGQLFIPPEAEIGDTDSEHESQDIFRCSRFFDVYFCDWFVYCSCSRSDPRFHETLTLSSRSYPRFTETPRSDQGVASE